jgi:hypothetical protein
MFDTVFGCDPEVFVIGKDGVIPPAAFIADYGIKFADIKAPKKILIQDGDEWKIIEDGAATELNVKPSDDFDSLWNRIVKAVSSLEIWLKQTPMPKKEHAKIVIIPSVPFDSEKYWHGRDESFRDCVRFGCDPDLDIYSGQYSKEINVEHIHSRFGGGHIHMQAPLDNSNLFEENYYYITRLMDFIVGNTSTAIKRKDESIDEAEIERLKYYGRPGKIRLQTYSKKVKGIEYRTPSNFWIDDKDAAFILLQLMNCCYNLIQFPQDASNILNIRNQELVPQNILEYNKIECSFFSQSVLDKLVEMHYLSFKDFESIYKKLTYAKR